VNVDNVALKAVSTPHLVADPSYPSKSPIFWVPCWTTIPPSPTVVDPEANSTNLSATSKFTVSANEAVPNTVRSPFTTKSSTVTLSSKVTVIVCPTSAVVILVPPAISNV